MKTDSEKNQRLHQKAKYHVRKHRKKYTRFVLFFVFLLLFRILEDYSLLTSPFFEIEFDIIIFLVVSLSALIFTIIAEVTEMLIEEEEAEKLLKLIKKNIRRKR